MNELRRAFHAREAAYLRAAKQKVDAQRLAAAPGSEEARIWATVGFAVCNRLHDVTFMLNQDAMQQAAEAQLLQQPASPEAAC